MARHGHHDGRRPVGRSAHGRGAGPSGPGIPAVGGGPAGLPGRNRGHHVALTRRVIARIIRAQSAIRTSPAKAVWELLGRRLPRGAIDEPPYAARRAEASCWPDAGAPVGATRTSDPEALRRKAS